jgi:hypothetical protein
LTAPHQGAQALPAGPSETTGRHAAVQQVGRKASTIDLSRV